MEVDIAELCDASRLLMAGQPSPHSRCEHQSKLDVDKRKSYPQEKHLTSSSSVSNYKENASYVFLQRGSFAGLMASVTNIKDTVGKNY